jgi:tetratricopeptide (TPR) repeat protein
MLFTLALLRWSAGDSAGAIEAEEQRHALAVEIGTEDVIASSLNNLATYHWVDGDLEQAIDLYRQAVGFTGAPMAGRAAANLSVALVDAHRLAEADQIMGTLLEERLDAHGKVSVARLRAEQGELQESAHLLQENIDEVQAIGGVALCDFLRVTARLAGLASQAEAAALLLGAADSADLHPGWPFTRGDRARATPPAKQALGTERFQHLYAEGQGLSPEQAGSLANEVAANVLATSPATADQAADT